MRVILSCLVVLSAWLLLPALGASQEAKTLAPSAAQLQADLHRATADLIEARNAAEPDQAKIKQLSDKVQKLRGEVAPAGALLGRGWGGPGRGPCAVAGVPGPGYGRAYGWGPGRGYGYGHGWGYGGYGRGWGRGPGWGPGRGWGFVDADNSGVCDRFEAATGQK